MSKSLYVGNLPWSVGEEDLKKTFGEHGAVVGARVVMERDTGRSRGFGFVDVEDNDADKIVSAMNGFSWNGRQIVVNEARPRSQQ